MPPVSSLTSLGELQEACISLKIGAAAEILKCVEYFYFDLKNFRILKITLNFQLYGEVAAS